MTVPIVPGPDQPQYLPPIPVVPPASRRRLSQGAIGGIVVGACLVIGLGYLLLGGSWPPKFFDGTGDVTVESCGMSSSRVAEANLLIHNSTSSAHDYTVRVTFKQDGVQVGTATAVVRGLAAGGVARDRAVSPVSARSVTCSVTDVNRS